MISNVSTRPNFSVEEINRIIHKDYDFECTVKKLVSEIGQNFLVTDKRGHKFVFKIFNANEKRQFIEAQSLVFELLNKNCQQYSFPQNITTKQGDKFSKLKSNVGLSHYFMLLSFINGIFLSQSKLFCKKILFDFGKFLATMDKTLKNLDIPACNRELLWDLKNTLQARDKLHYITNISQRRLVEYFLLQFESFVLPNFSKLKRVSESI